MPPNPEEEGELEKKEKKKGRRRKTEEKRRRTAVEPFSDTLDPIRDENLLLFSSLLPHLLPQSLRNRYNRSIMLVVRLSTGELEDRRAKVGEGIDGGRVDDAARGEGRADDEGDVDVFFVREGLTGLATVAGVSFKAVVAVSGRGLVTDSCTIRMSRNVRGTRRKGKGKGEKG